MANAPVSVAPATGTSFWENISSEAGPAPSPRTMSQYAYDPALGAVVLFGGYNGLGGNVAIGDTWELAGDQWTALPNATGSPPAGWGGAMVYDASDSYMLLFGGRNDTGFFNDTWAYNATGWHLIVTAQAPSPRAWFAMTYDRADNDVVLFGGGFGNLPPTYTRTFFSDTWTYHAGVWTNITATAGSPPAARNVEGQMAYDAADGYALLTGGWLNGLVCPFESSYGQTWALIGSSWSQLSPLGAAPPPGRGAIVFDPTSNTTLYYESEQNESPSSWCDQYGTAVWSYSGGSWTLVTNSSYGAPSPRTRPMFAADPLNQTDILFGGEGPSAQYLNDTWALYPAGDGPALYPVTFSETGLENGTAWDVTLGARTLFSANSTIVFWVVNGTYSYTIGTTEGYSPTPSTGFVVVAGAAVSVNVTITLVTVTFTETGLPRGREWTVVLNGAPETSTASSITFFGVPNGPQAYFIHSEGGFRVSGLPPQGTIAVIGSEVTVSVTFVRGTTYAITFHEVGLQIGTRWCVTVVSMFCGRAPGSLSIKGLTPGAYSYAIGSVGDLRTVAKVGAVPVATNGSLTLTRSLAFQVRFEYAVWVEEIGLPNGTTWSVSIGGSTESSTFSSLLFYLTNGTYRFSVHGIHGYAVTPRSASLLIAGPPSTIVVTFTLRILVVTSGSAAGPPAYALARASEAADAG
ncbi:MAG: kelch repeat-containing protein [Thermoplasmata archaeon]